MHRWPDAEAVLAAAETWAKRLAERVSGIVAVGVFGSYARGEAGFGSDLDLVVIVRDPAAMPDPADDTWAMEDLPVPADRGAMAGRRPARVARGGRVHGTPRIVPRVCPRPRNGAGG